MRSAKSSPKIVIIGAGPCGLGAAWRLTELGYRDFVLYEKESYVGGLATSFVDGSGFTWDIGGHVLHSHYEYFDRMFASVMADEFFTHQRESWVWIYDRFVPYPFQNNIHRLPKAVFDECLAELKKTQRNPPATLRNFEDWVRASFGSGIAKHFLIPYNNKVWAYPPAKMNFRWVGDRVATVDTARIERNNAEDRDDVSWGPNAVFEFPKHGGTGDIWNRVAERFRDRIRLNKQVTGVDRTNKTVSFADGTTETYDLLLTTLPLTELVRMADDPKIPRESPLHYSSVTIVGLGLAGTPKSALSSKCWMYFPEDKAPFFRATVFSNYSKYNAPEGHWSLMTEVSSSRYRPLPDGDIGEAVVRGARNTQLIGGSDAPVSVWVHRSAYGYPTPTLGRDEYIDEVLPKLERQGIYSRGRFGAWRYEVSNQDHTFMQGVEWVDHVLEGREEITVHHPEIVNAKK